MLTCARLTRIGYLGGRLHCGQRVRKGIILMATTHHRWVSQIMAPSIAKRLLVWVIGTRVPEKPMFVNGSLWSGGMVFNTLRQRISRLVRKALSFSKKLEHHIGPLWYFIHHYHASLA
jgi:hypothetical protein